MTADLLGFLLALAGAVLGWGTVYLVRWWLERRRAGRLEAWALYCMDCHWAHDVTVPADWPVHVRFAAAAAHVRTHRLHEVQGRRVTR